MYNLKACNIVVYTYCRLCCLITSAKRSHNKVHALVINYYRRNTTLFFEIIKH